MIQVRLFVKKNPSTVTEDLQEDTNRMWYQTHDRQHCPPLRLLPSLLMIICSVPVHLNFFS